jgi:hypothetical protein
MARFLFLFLACITAANAGPLTSVSCAFGSITQVASGPIASVCSIPAGSPSVFADAHASESFSPFSADLITSAEAGAESDILPPLTEYQVSSGAATGNIQLETPGPARQGLIRFDIEVTNLHSGSAFAAITDGFRQYRVQSTAGGCQLHACSDAARMPITLGSLLVARSDSGTFLSGNFAFESAASAAGRAEIKFSLFEADGVTPVAMFAVPEPSGVAFLLADGIFFVLLLRRCRT